MGGGLTGDVLGGAGEGEATAGEGIAGGGFRLDQENAGARVGAEMARVGGESADVDYEGAVGLEQGGDDGGVGGAVGCGGAEDDGRKLRAESGGEFASAGEGGGHEPSLRRGVWGGQGRIGFWSMVLGWLLDENFRKGCSRSGHLCDFDMRITVHRGSRQIGGSCIELTAGTSRIVLDAGLPLEADISGNAPIPDVLGLFDREGPPVDGLFLSHAHADHSGLVAASRAQVPVWLSAGTSKMVMAGGLFARQPDVPRARRRLLVPGEPVTVGAFRVTAYPVDHSVFDAMAFLVEADGQRLLYTGDLRFHGRKPGMARQLAKIAKAAPLDALVIEGTRLGGRASESNLSERDLETQVCADMRAAPGVVLAMYSPLNVDRFVTCFRAARRARRTFVIDPYQAFVLHLIGRQARLPQSGTTPDLRVLVPPRFSASGAARRLGHTSWARELSRGAISTDEIAQTPERFAVLFRQSMQPWLYRSGFPQGATCIFSYWPGYLREPRLQALTEAINTVGGQFLQRHASGHAHPDDLRRFVEDVRPRLLVPVHTTSPETWAKWWPGTRVAVDGEPIEIS